MSVLACEPGLQEAWSALTALPHWHLSPQDVTSLPAVPRGGKLPWTHLYFILMKSPPNFYFIRISLALGKWPNFFLNERKCIFESRLLMLQLGREGGLLGRMAILPSKQWCCWSVDGHYLLMTILRAIVKPPESRKKVRCASPSALTWITCLVPQFNLMSPPKASRLWVTALKLAHLCLQINHIHFFSFTNSSSMSKCQQPKRYSTAW